MLCVLCSAINCITIITITILEQALTDEEYQCIKDVMDLLHFQGTDVWDNNHTVFINVFLLKKTFNKFIFYSSSCYRGDRTGELYEKA